MAKSIVGLDIGTASIRAVELGDASGAKPTLLRFAEVPVPEGAVSRGEVLETNTVAGALKKLWSIGKFRSKDVVLGMGNQRVLSRDLTVPRAPLAQIRESLPFQVQDMLPVPVGDAILDFYPVSEGQGENGPVVNGLLIAAVRDAVLANVKAVQLAGLNPAGVDLIPFALSRAVVTRNRVPGTVALVELGAATTSIVVLTDGVPQFVRIIPTGGDEITRKVAAGLEIPLSEAEVVKRHLGISDRAQTADDFRAVAIIRDVVNELLGSIRNTLNYFTNTHAATPIAHLFIVGGGAFVPGLLATLGDYTRLPVSFGDALSTAGLARSISQQDLAARGSALAVAYALAVGSTAK